MGEGRAFKLTGVQGPCSAAAGAAAEAGGRQGGCCGGGRAKASPPRTRFGFHA